MGTNYYTLTDPCKHCSRGEEEIHLGKSSGGWKFLFRLNQDYYKNVKELKKFLKGKLIKDEYGEVVSHKEFWELVEFKQKHHKDHNDGHCIMIDGYRFLSSDFC